jgi:hypothetical protein
MAEPDPIKVAEIDAHMAAMNFYVGMLNAETDEDREAVKERQRSTLDAIKSSPKADAEKIAWMNRYTEVLQELSGEKEIDIPADKEWRYIDPESGADECATIEALLALVSTGLLSDDVRVKRPRSNVWLAAGEFSELRGALAEWRARIAWRVRVGGQEYEAVGVQTVADWIAAGRVLPDTEIFNPYDRAWRKAKDEPKLKAVQFVKKGCLSVIAFWMT